MLYFQLLNHLYSRCNFWFLEAQLEFGNGRGNRDDGSKPLVQLFACLFFGIVYFSYCRNIYGTITKLLPEQQSKISAMLQLHVSIINIGILVFAYKHRGSHPIREDGKPALFNGNCYCRCGAEHGNLIRSFIFLFHWELVES